MAHNAQGRKDGKMINNDLGTIDLKGPLPKPYMFEFDPPIKLQAKRTYWVGLNNRLGRLRYWYYDKRGWIKNTPAGNYYVKPRESAAVEWLHCLVSPSHARATWLRLTPEAEERALLVLKRAVIGLFIALAFVVGVNAGQWRMKHYIQNHPEQIQIERPVYELPQAR